MERVSNLAIASDVVIAGAFYAIAAAFVYLLRRRQDLKLTGLLALVALFLVACGTTHVLEVYQAFTPAGGPAGLVKLVTAVASVATTVVLWPVVPRLPGVTGRQRSEERLRQSEERLRLAVDAAELGTWDADLLTRRTAYSPRANLMYGFPADTAGITREEFLAVVHPDDRPWLVARVEGILAGPVRTYEAEYRIVHPGGSVRWLSSHGEVQRGERGEALRILGVVADVTERRESEAALRQMNEELERRVGQRTRELEASNRELETFSYSVSHDLRAPLRTIDGFTQILGEEHGAALGSDGLAMLGRITGGVKRMSQLIDALLELARVTRVELRLEQVDLSGLAAEILAELAAAAPERRVETRVAPGLVARGDARLLRVVLTNLLDNAWKFSAGSPAARITVDRRPVDGQDAFVVQDNGAGFDMKYVTKLFGAFQRLHAADEFPGSGVGLATVQRIVHRHGGWIRAEATPGQGATFAFTLGQGGAS